MQWSDGSESELLRVVIEWLWLCTVVIAWPNQTNHQLRPHSSMCTPGTTGVVNFCQWRFVDLAMATRAVSLPPQIFFDDPPKPDAKALFLASKGHHLLIVSIDGTPAGFVTGVEMTHPDKGAEMFVYELGVGEEFQRRGIAGALLAELKAVALERSY